MAQDTEGLGVPLALQVSTLLSPGARTRFLGAPLIQYGAAENRTERRRINHRTHRVHEPIVRRGPTGCAALHHAHTFDRDADGLVHRAQRIPGGAAVLSRVRLRHVHDPQRLVVVQERRALGRELAAHFGPRYLRGGPGLKQEEREREAGETKRDEDT